MDTIQDIRAKVEELQSELDALRRRLSALDAGDSRAASDPVEMEPFDISLEDIPESGAAFYIQKPRPQLVDLPPLDGPAPKEEAPKEPVAQETATEPAAAEKPAPEPAKAAEPAPEPAKAEEPAPARSRKPRAPRAWMLAAPGAPVGNIISAIPLNERVLLINTLFHQDPLLFNSTIGAFNAMSSIEEVEDYVLEHFPDWNLNSKVVYNLMMAVRRKLR